MPTRRHIVIAFLTALALRGFAAAILPVVPTWDGAIYERAASDLARGDGFTRRALRPSAAPRPTSFYPVGWPAVLSVWRAAGAARVHDPLLQTLLGALAVPLAAALSGRLAGRRGAVVAAWVVALWPGGILAAASWMHEPLFTVLLLAATLAAVRSTRPAALVLSAAIFGLAAYVRPTVLAAVPLTLAAAAWAPKAVSPHGQSGQSESWSTNAMKSGLTATLGLTLALAVLAPWIARNVAVIGGTVISTNAGANLLVGATSSTFARPPAELDCPSAEDELARDRCRRDRALEHIAAHPVRWMALAPAKLFHTFGYETSAAVQLGEALGLRPTRDPRVWALAGLSTVYWLALLVFAARGWLWTRARSTEARLRTTRLRARRVILAPILALLAVHVVFFGGDRYHLPLVPLLAALAAPALLRALRPLGWRANASA